MTDKQVQLLKELEMKRARRKASQIRKKIVEKHDTSKHEILKEMRILSRRQRKQIRAQDRERERRERTKRIEDLARRSESRLAKQIAEKHRTKILKSFMTQLEQRQSEFLKGLSKRMGSWSRRQRSIAKRQQYEFRRLNRNLSVKLRRIEKKIDEFE